MLQKHLLSYRTMINPFLYKTRTTKPPLLQTFSSTKRQSPCVKPPNILLYCPQQQEEAVVKVSELIERCIIPDRYTVYVIDSRSFYHDPWFESTALLVLWMENFGSGCDNKKLMKRVGQFEAVKGRILSFMPQTLDNVSIKRVTELPNAEKYELTFDNRRTVTTFWNGFFIECGNYTSLATVDHKGLQHQVAALSERKNVINTTIPLVISTPNKIVEVNSDALKLLLEQLEITCKQEEKQSSPCYSVRSHVAQMFATSKEVQRNFFSRLDLSLLSLCDSFAHKAFGWNLMLAQKFDEKSFSDSDLSVVCSESCNPLNDGFLCDFDWELYKANLKTKIYGNLVVYADVIGSTMNVFDGLCLRLPPDSGVVAIAKQQTRGQGRGGNKWLSPVGCAMFTVVLVIPVESRLGKSLPFLQHLTAVAVVHAVRSLPQLQDVDMRVKWPNDIYFGSTVKLGGVVIKSTIYKNNCIASIGCGVNTANQRPTVCLNQILEDHYATSKQFKTEELIARTLTVLESLVEQFQRRGPQGFLELYYKYWLHSGTYVKVLLSKEEPESNALNALVVGVDDCGYIRVRFDDGNVKTLHPDGNSFDLTRNLILPKQ